MTGFIHKGTLAELHETARRYGFEYLKEDTNAQTRTILYQASRTGAIVRIILIRKGAPAHSTGEKTGITQIHAEPDLYALIT
jgi:hypothetical protein